MAPTSSTSGIRTSWSDLPTELLDRIAKRLDTETDVRRFRAVCTSWRSSTPPFPKFPATSLKLPCPIPTGDSSHSKLFGVYFTLAERTVYRVESPQGEKPDFWVVKVEDRGDGKLRLLNPVSDRRIKTVPGILMPKVLDTLDFRVTEVCKAYALRLVFPRVSACYGDDDRVYAKKVVVFPGVGKDDEYVVMTVDNGDRLWYIKSGGEKWTLVCACEMFHDVVNYKGQFYGLSFCGSVFEFVSMFDWKKIVYHTTKREATWKRLVELYNYDGLFLVEEVAQEDKCVCSCYGKGISEIIISRIDKRVEKWIETKMVNDKIIFVGDDCSFSFSAKDFQGCKGTRVFYTDPYIFFRTKEEQKQHFHEDDVGQYDGDDDSDYGFNYWECNCGDSSDDDGARKVDNFVPSDDVKFKFRGFHHHSIGVCDFVTGKIGSLLRYHEFADIFWPPPSWLWLCHS